MQKDNISIDTLKLIIRAGVVMGQANPNKSTDEVIKVLLQQFINQFI